MAGLAYLGLLTAVVVAAWRLLRDGDGTSQALGWAVVAFAA